MAQEPLVKSSGTTASKNDGMRLQGIKLAPFSRPRPGRMWTIRVGVKNESTEPQAALVMGRIEQVPQFQSAIEAHLRPGERREVSLRLQIPEHLKAKDYINLNVSMNSLDADNRVLLSPDGTPLIDSLKLPVEVEENATAFFINPDPPHPPEWLWPYDAYQMYYETIVASRVDSELTRRLYPMDEEVLPSQLADLEGLDSIVIAQEGLLRDAASCDALVRWMSAGGHLWVTMEMIGEESLDRILPDGMSCQAIDEIELNDFVVDKDALIFLSEDDRRVNLENPVRMRRVVQTGGSPQHRINGFPASIWYEIGKGRLLVTTLEARGWVTRRTTFRSTEAEKQSDFQMRVWAQNLANRFYDLPATAAPMKRANIVYPLKQIGNPVLDRGFVLSIVFGFCGVLSLVGWWCWHVGRMVRMGWLVPLLSLAATLPILIASNRVRREIPDTSSHLQVIEVLPGSRSITATHWTTTYMSNKNRSNWVAAGDVVTTWPYSKDQSDLRNWHWKDFESWQLSSTGWPQGLWNMKTRYALPARDLDVVGRLDRDGLSVELPKALNQPLEDAVLCYVGGDVALCDRMPLGQTVRIPSSQLTSSESWIASSIVNDEQGRRDEVYQQLRARVGDERYPSYPALLGWTKLWPGPVSWSDSRGELGSALVVLPVRLSPVPSGETITVPHCLITVKSATGPEAQSTAFHNASSLWAGETTIGMTVPLRFSLPPQVRPFEASEIQCDFQMRAPQRLVKVMSEGKEGDVVLGEFKSPLSSQSLRITDPAILTTLSDGDSVFKIAVGEDSGGTGVSGNWQMDYFRLTVRGTVGKR